MSAGNDCWRWYSGGILSELDECPTSIDHGVALVGLAGSADGTDYWIVQNSWGQNWGDHGFIYLAVETGLGVSAMNKYVQFMSTDQDYPLEDEDDSVAPLVLPANCDHNESNN